MRKEFELQCRLNQRYLDPADYQKFLDTRPKPVPAQNAPNDPRLQIGANGGPPLTPEDMGAPLAPDAAPPGLPAPPEMAAPMQAAPAPEGGALIPFPVQQQMAPQPTPQEDFDLEDLDIRPVADPTAITDMQRMAKAQFKLQFLNDPACNRVAIIKSVWKDARIANVEEFIVEKNPVLERQAQLEEALKQAEVALKQADAKLKDAQAQKIGAEGESATEDRALRTRELDQKDRELTQKDDDIALRRRQADLDRFRTDMDDADKEVRLMMEGAKGKREDRALDIQEQAAKQKAT